MACPLWRGCVQGTCRYNLGYLGWVKVATVRADHARSALGERLGAGFGRVAHDGAPAFGGGHEGHGDNDGQRRSVPEGAQRAQRLDQSPPIR